MRRGGLLPRRETARVPSLHGWVETLRGNDLGGVDGLWVCFSGVYDGGVICRDGS